MSLWHAARLERRQQVTPHVVRLALEVPPIVAESVTAPGQYHSIQLPSGESALFAIASVPGETELEYVVRLSSLFTESLAAVPVGTTLSVSEATGPGFPIDAHHGKNIVLIGTGTGTAPLRAALETMLMRRSDFGDVTFLFGVRDRAEFVFRSDIERWERSGVRVIEATSGVVDAAEGQRRRVQELVPLTPPNTQVALICGQLEMEADVRQLLLARGLKNEEILQNH